MCKDSVITLCKIGTAIIFLFAWSHEMFFYKEVFVVEVTSWLFFTSCINDITNVIFFFFSPLFVLQNAKSKP